MPTKLFRLFRLHLLRWHRRLGVAVSLLLIWLALSGIALNHSADWGLDQIAGPELLQSVYSGDTIEFTSYRAGDVWVSHNGGSTLYVQGKELGYCSQPFVGAVEFDGELVAACGDQLLLMTPAAELIESIDIAYDLETMPTSIGISEAGIWLRGEEGIYLADLSSLIFDSAPHAKESIAWASPGLHGKEIQVLLEQASFGSGVSLTQMLLDLHSGRFFGKMGTLGMDVVAIVLILLATSGVWVWSTKPGRFRRKKNPIENS
ncbi:MAG: PepSY domain-containing protein [Halioglobus sp.]